MNEIRRRLILCFQNVFPNLRTEDVSRANAATVGAWDSLAHITLLSAIAEEFGVEFEPEDFEELVSYELIAGYLEKRGGG